MVDLTSPDGAVKVRLGDVAIPSYFVPNQFHPREGDVYDLDAQAQMTVANYRTGQEFAALYGEARFKRVCASMSPAQNSPVVLHDYIPEQVPAVRVSEGQLSSQCAGGKVDQLAFVYAKTALFQGFWQALTLGSYLAPAGQIGLARTVLVRAAQSFRLSPQWVQYQAKMDQDALVYQRARQQARLRVLSRQVAEMEMRMHGMRSEVNAFERQQGRQAAQVEKWGNLLTGVTPAADPLGNPRSVWTGPKSNYWTNGVGKVINSDTAPGPGWQPLTTR
jgi:hypothetical protein